MDAAGGATEGALESGGSAPVAGSAPGEAPAAALSTSIAADAPPVDDEELQDEGLRVLMYGFITGLSIAGVFLIYVVLEAARLLP